MITKADNTYGDASAWSGSLGRPRNFAILSDSVAVNWSPIFYSGLPKLRGMDANLSVGGGADTFPPSSPSFASSYNIYGPRDTTGAGVLAADAANGATSLSITWTSNTGSFNTGMKITITDGVHTDVIPVASGQASFNNPVSVPLSSGLTHAYTAGATVTWARPSGIASYWWRPNTEIIFSAAASTANDFWFQSQLCRGFVPTSYGADESIYLNQSQWSNRSIRVTHYYLAQPKGTNANCLRLNGVPATSGSPFQAGVVSLDFSPYAAVATIKSVSVVIPAPSPYNSRGVEYNVQSSGTGTFAAGDIYCPLGFYIEQVGATDGYGLWNFGNGGYQLGDYDNGSSYLPQAMTPAFQAQFIALASIDTLIIQLGINAWVDVNTGVTSIRQIIANARTGNPSLKAIVLDYYATPNFYNTSAPQIQTMMRTVAADPGVLGLDIFAESGNQAFVNTFLSTDPHPSDPLGKRWAADTVQSLLQRAASYGSASAVGGKASSRRFPQVGL